VAVFGRIVDAGGVVDEVVMTASHGPASYTGEDVVEISCHGGILIAARVLQTVLEAGARAAGPGEFTQRAFLNGKMDLTQAEAVMDLIRAQTPLAARAAAEQLEGRIGAAIQEIREALLDVVAHVEAYIDFPEEGISPDIGAALLARIGEVRARIGRLLATAGEGRILREGVRLAICGRPNAGKSSLLNRLLGFERAIVSASPGTTRDTIEEAINLRGIPFRIVDTAGMRETDDAVEREGVDRARRAIEGAGVVLHVVDASDPEAACEPAIAEAEIRVVNKIDLVGAAGGGGAGGGVRISCATGGGIEALVDAIVARAGHHAAAPGGSLAAINARHQACLARADASLARAGAALASEVEPEFVALDLRLALEAAGEVVGAVDTEDILGRIFSSFCIGK
jgi:tRNA modification GTPase